LRADVDGYRYSFNTTDHIAPPPTLTTSPNTTHITTRAHDTTPTSIYAHHYTQYLAGTQCSHCTSVALGEEVAVEVVLMMLRETDNGGDASTTGES